MSIPLVYVPTALAVAISFPSQGEAFGEDSMAIAQDFLPECFAPTGYTYWVFCQPLLLNRLSTPDVLFSMASPLLTADEPAALKRSRCLSPLVSQPPDPC
jgi:hypothetical protein